MKKLLLTAASAAVLSTSVLSTAFADVENMYYLKANAGGNMMNKTTDKWSGLKLKSKTAAIFGFGAGYYLMDNVRTDLSLEFVSSPELKKSGNFSNGHSGSAKHKGEVMALMVNAYVDMFDISVAKVFAGLGVGMSQVKEKVSIVDNTDSRQSGDASSKKNNNVAYQLTLGTSSEVAPGVNAELAYSWKDFGKTKAKSGDDSWAGTTNYRGHNLMAGIRFDL